MRKTALKKLNPNRHKMLMALRGQDNLREIVTKSGHKIYLNVMKRMMLNKPYVNEEYASEARRYINKAMKKHEEGVSNA